MGSVWCINSSLVGSYLAMSGEDHVIQVWEVTEGGRKCELLREMIHQREQLTVDSGQPPDVFCVKGKEATA
jgi:hypothetical protein